MTEPACEVRSFAAADGYPLHVAVWSATVPARGQVVVLHGVQSHSGWYHRLGQTLASSGYIASFPDRRGSGANTRDRGHTPSAGRLVKDLVEWMRAARIEHPGLPTALAGISWGGKIAAIVAGRHPELVDALALDLPWAASSGRSITEGAASDRLGLPHEPTQDLPDPTVRPLAIHGQSGRPGLHRRRSPQPPPGDGRTPGRQLHHRPLREPSPLADPPARTPDAGRPGSDRRQRQDSRIFREIGLVGPSGHRIPRGAPHAGIRPGSVAVRARSRRLVGSAVRLTWPGRVRLLRWAGNLPSVVHPI